MSLPLTKSFLSITAQLVNTYTIKGNTQNLVFWNLIPGAGFWSRVPRTWGLVAWANSFGNLHVAPWHFSWPGTSTGVTVHNWKSENQTIQTLWGHSAWIRHCTVCETFIGMRWSSLTDLKYATQMWLDDMTSGRSITATWHWRWDFVFCREMVNSWNMGGVFPMSGWRRQ